MTNRYHIKVNGTGFLVAPGSYVRSVPARPAEIKGWAVTDWRRGDGHPLAGGGGQGSGNGGFKAGFGVDVGTQGRLGLGPAVGVSLASAEDGFAAMAPYGGNLYAVSSSSGAVRSFDGSSWSIPWSAPVPLRFICQGYGELMMGGSDGKVYAYDPWAATWGERFTVGTGEVTALVETMVNEPVTGGYSVEPRVVFGLSRATGSGKMVAVSADGVTTLTRDVGESRVEAMALYRGKLYLATSWGSAASGGRLLVYGARAAGSYWELSEVASFSDAAPLSLVVADGLLWIGRAGGTVMAWDGTKLVEAMSLEGRGVPASSLKGMANCGESLYVGFEHPGEGASLMARQPASVSGAAPGLAGAGDGWAMECGSGTVGSVSALGVYGGTVLFGREQAGGATIHMRRLDAWRTSGWVELPAWDGGDGTTVKLLHAVTLSHEVLRVGESIKVSYSLDGGAWVELGTSSVDGSACTAFAWPGVVSCRSLGLRVEMASGSDAAGPVLTGISVAYSLAGDGRRRWRFDARCEGVPGVPLRLLDGSVEPLSGAALASALQTAYGAGVVDFEDLDGTAWRALFRSLEEDPGKLPQERGGPDVGQVRAGRVVKSGLRTGD